VDARFENLTGTSTGFPASRFDSVTSRLIQAYPLPNLPGLANNYATNPKHIQDWDQGDVRIDWNVVSSTWTLTCTCSWT
jgi:hypothetical protein